MLTRNFTLTLVTEQSPEDVFRAIRNVRDWWSGYYSEEIQGNTETLNDEFSFRAADGAHFSKQKLVEVIPNKKIVWLITESKFTYIEDQDEWTDTKVIFEISRSDGKTQLVFTHEGLTPEVECYDACASGWTQYLQNKLLPMIMQLSLRT
jgi:uncharacterized protein YndB with AHSA1/START domain